MTDSETLLQYRLNQAKETLSDAQTMLESQVTPRSILNRAYYAIFYSILALFIKDNIPVKTSKHSGIISLFDKEYVHAGKIDKKYSKILHRAFDERLENDYKEFVTVSLEEASVGVEDANLFLEMITLFFESE